MNYSYNRSSKAEHVCLHDLVNQRDSVLYLLDQPHIILGEWLGNGDIMVYIHRLRCNLQGLWDMLSQIDVYVRMKQIEIEKLEKT